MNVIIDTGCANLSSLKFAIERLGYTTLISADSKVIRGADKVFLPGVGTAKHAMLNLRERQLEGTIKALTQPVLGICLGMQLLNEYSVEGQDGNATQCLSIIPGGIEPLCQEELNKLRIPHMGWNTCNVINDSPLFAGISTDDYFYFVHSYGAALTDCTLAQCQYNAYVDPQHQGPGITFSAALNRNNFYGVQFHPERSGKSGSRLLKNFLEMAA